MKSLKLLKLVQEVVFMSVEKVTISKSEYEALLDAKEELEDIQTVEYALANPEEGMPSALVERLIDGENPLSIYRKWRGFNQSSLARASGVNRTQIADIEAGRSMPSVLTLKKLAKTLKVDMDMLV